jgi:conjugative transposon TraM protein
MESAAKKMKQRKFLLILPLLVIPFLTMGFWALGGGQGSTTGNEVAKSAAGLNLNLPKANIQEEKDPSKMSFYEKARKEEERSLEAIKSDPYFNLSTSDSNEVESFIANSPTKYKPPVDYSGLNTSPIHSKGFSDPNEAKIMKKLNQLQREINKPQDIAVSKDVDRMITTDDYGINEDVDRLEEMMHVMKEKPGDDPEMKRLDGMLDKIMDIQHPERVKERLQEKSVQQKGKVFPVSRSSKESSVSLLGANDTFGRRQSAISGDGFFGSNDNNQIEAEQNAIEAVVHETKSIVNGAVVKFRLQNDIFVNGILIPKDHFLFGLGSLDGERLRTEINSIRYGGSLFPVKLVVYDLDGLEGIYMPGAISRDVAKQSVDNGLQNLELTTLNPSIAAQATTTGINAAKSLLSKKTKLIKVTVKAGYKVLLKDKNNDQ